MIFKFICRMFIRSYDDKLALLNYEHFCLEEKMEKLARRLI